MMACYSEASKLQFTVTFTGIHKESAAFDLQLRKHLQGFQLGRTQGFEEPGGIWYSTGRAQLFKINDIVS